MGKHVVYNCTGQNSHMYKLQKAPQITSTKPKMPRTPTFLYQFLPKSCDLQFLFVGFLGRPEPPGPLLVHLGSWCHTVDSHIKHSTWPHDGKQTVYTLQ